MGYIYKITNDVNNKVYIGQTKRDLNSRWKEHKIYSQESDSKTKFYLAIKNIGIEHFNIEPIEEVFGVEERNKREIYWINFYDSFNNGYNSTSGGGCFDYNNISKLERQNIIIEMRLRGESYIAITKQLHCGKAFIAEALRKANLLGKDSRSCLKEQAILELLKEGYYLVDIAKELKCGIKIIKKVLSEHPELSELYYDIYHPLDKIIWNLKENDKLSAKEISKKLNCCDETIYRAINRMKKQQ